MIDSWREVKVNTATTKATHKPHRQQDTGQGKVTRVSIIGGDEMKLEAQKQLRRDIAEAQRRPPQSEGETMTGVLSEEDLHDCLLAVGEENVAWISEEVNRLIVEQGIDKVEAIESALRRATFLE